MLLAQAEAALRAGQLERALEHCAASGASAAWGLRGAALLRLGRLEAAAEAFQTALAAAPEDAADAPSLLLQLAQTQRYRGAFGEAERALERAARLAREARDGGLLLAVRCGEGEVALAENDPRRALLRFGEARGLAERARDERLSVLPLAGLGEAQARAGFAAKGARMAAKALERARAHRDPFGTARALLALGVATGSSERLQEAEASALELPHAPLAALARRSREALEGR